jgi:hypothetical protein
MRSNSRTPSSALQRLDLTRGRRLTQMQPLGGTGEPTGVGGGDQSLQLWRFIAAPQLMQKSHE